MLRDYCIGTSFQYICAQYAKSGRSTCRKCKQKIGNEQLRIGILVDDDHFSTAQAAQWFHKPCFHFKARHALLEPNQIAKKIYGIQGLNKNDQRDLLNYLKAELNTTKQPKNKRRIQSKSKNKKKEEDSKKQQQKKKPTLITKNQRKTRSMTHPKIDLKPEPIVQTNIKAKNKSKYNLKKQPSKNFLSQIQMAEYKKLSEEYAIKNLLQLKEILQKNNQVKTGTKEQLVARCADGKQFGKIPSCSKCGGGKLRFNRQKGTYACPGYMEDTDFINCCATFVFDQIKRLQWQE